MKKYTIDTLIEADPSIIYDCRKFLEAEKFLLIIAAYEDTLRKNIMLGIAGLVVAFFVCFLMGPVRFNAMF